MKGCEGESSYEKIDAVESDNVKCTLKNPIEPREMTRCRALFLVNPVEPSGESRFIRDEEDSVVNQSEWSIWGTKKQTEIKLSNSLHRTY
uniref:Uncharacterized protein n=1 Tax=Pristionchus pacificus TaxID=54126 RepID=A0A2A6C116_PRIPA|eukprot:PDM71809.1 hypothetical protein PRIPAC_38216 [Pristionchus pacificus]